jgi:hypothetical protein
MDSPEFNLDSHYAAIEQALRESFSLKKRALDLNLHERLEEIRNNKKSCYNLQEKQQRELKDFVRTTEGRTTATTTRSF